MFSTLGPDTLKELRAAAGAARVHAFADMHDLGDMLVAAGFSAPVMDMEMLTIAYPRPAAGCSTDLRASGQTSARADRPRGLAGRRFAEALRGAARAEARRSRWCTATHGSARARSNQELRKPCVFSSACLEARSPDVILCVPDCQANYSQLLDVSGWPGRRCLRRWRVVVLAIGAGFAHDGGMAGAAVCGAGSAGARRRLPGVRAALRHGRTTDRLNGEQEMKGASRSARITAAFSRLAGRSPPPARRMPSTGTSRRRRRRWRATSTWLHQYVMWIIIVIFVGVFGFMFYRVLRAPQVDRPQGRAVPREHHRRDHLDGDPVADPDGHGLAGDQDRDRAEGHLRRRTSRSR